MDINAIGIDLAKSVFELHSVDAQGNVVLEKKVRRTAFLAALEKLPACVVGYGGMPDIASPGTAGLECRVTMSA